MKEVIKIFLSLFTIILFIILAFLIYFKAQEKLISKAHAIQLIEKRYDGEVTKINEGKVPTHFIARVDAKKATYEIKIDRKNENFLHVKKIKDKSSQLNETDSEANKSQKGKNGKDLRNKSNKHIDQATAKKIAHQQVGGKFKNINKVKDNGFESYAVTQMISEVEGATVNINSVTGKVTSISWFKSNQIHTMDESEYNSGMTPPRNHFKAYPSENYTQPQPHESIDDDNGDEYEIEEDD